ncbi:MAG: glutamyl-tRNA reductase [Bacteroidota bacterium]|nr:glutamyl-tRNA reductase [Bacteroidota bacterium]
MNQLKVVSISYKKAPIEVRELFSYDENGCKRLLSILKERFDLTEALVISTCNRTEVYYNSPFDLNKQIIQFLSEETEFSQYNNVSEYFIAISNPTEAAKYLFEVSLGLHSQVLGDLQISGQAKDAYQWSADMDMAGPILHRLMHSVFFTNKRIVQETNFRDGAASVSYAAAELIDDITQGIKTQKILLLGTGEIGADVAKNLVEFGYTNISICNRTKSNAIELASNLKNIDAQIFDFDKLKEAIYQSDIIISAIQVSSPLINNETLKQINILNHKYFIDLSVPRSIDEEIENIHGVLLYNIEELNKKASIAQSKRLESIPKVKLIIDEALSEFNNWSKEMEFSPLIHKIKGALENIRTEELDRFNKQLTENELKLVETITKNIIQKVIKLPVIQLKAACKRGDADNLAEVLSELFDLEKQKELK